jgi:hypothetical protein
MRGESGTEETELWHDPELPFLDVLGQEIRRKAERAALLHRQRHHLASEAPLSRGPIPERRRGSAAGPETITTRTARRREALHGPMRIARRSLTLMLLLCLIGASAYGASEVFSKSTRSPLSGRSGPFALVATGSSGSEGWRLRLYAHSDELCRVLSVSETEASDCAATPSPGAVEATSAQGPSSRYLFGVAGARVMRVRVRFAHADMTVSTHALKQSLARVDDLPSHVRYWVIALPRPMGRVDPVAKISGLSRSGERLGAPFLSCLETGESGHC